jgi:hypothetical protein
VRFLFFNERLNRPRRSVTEKIAARHLLGPSSTYASRVLPSVTSIAAKTTANAPKKGGEGDGREAVASSLVDDLPPFERFRRPDKRSNARLSEPILRLAFK